MVSGYNQPLIEDFKMTAARKSRKINARISLQVKHQNKKQQLSLSLLPKVNSVS